LIGYLYQNKKKFANQKIIYYLVNKN